MLVPRKRNQLSIKPLRNKKLMATMPADLAGSEETVETIQIETPDYTDYELLNPGFYTSPSRVVTPERRVGKNGPFIMARVEMSQLVNEEGNTIYLSRPLVKYIFSFTRKQKNRQGETSEIAKYLRAAGIQLEGNVSPQVVQEALSESAALPVQVKVGWTNRTPKQPDGTYLQEKAYTGDFRSGANGSATFHATLTEDEVASLAPGKQKERLTAALWNGKVQAKHRVEEFFPFRG